MPRDNQTFGIGSIVQPTAIEVNGYIVSDRPIDVEALMEAVDPDGDFRFYVSHELDGITLDAFNIVWGTGVEDIDPDGNTDDFDADDAEYPEYPEYPVERLGIPA